MTSRPAVDLDRSPWEVPVPDPLQTNLVLWRGAAGRIGMFRCRTWHPRFTTDGATTGHLMAFPRTSVRIHHEGQTTVQTDSGLVTLYNHGQPYCREAVDPRGDICEWFSPSDHLVVESFERIDPAVADRPSQPFTTTHVFSPDPVYLRQRLVVEHLLKCLDDDVEPDHVWVAESMLWLLDQVVEITVGARVETPHRAAAPTAEDHRAMVDRARRWLDLHAHEKLRLEGVADAAFASPSHLCRVFRLATGSTVHHYLTQLRLRRAIDRVVDPDRHIADIALETGFAHHSHFTAAFRKAFGAPPNEVRRGLGAGGHRDLVRRLEAA